MKPKYRIIKKVDQDNSAIYVVQSRVLGFLFWARTWTDIDEYAAFFRTAEQAEGWIRKREERINRPTIAPYTELVGYYDIHRDNYLTLTPELMDAVREGNRDKEMEILAKMEKLRHG